MGVAFWYTRSLRTRRDNARLGPQNRILTRDARNVSLGRAVGGRQNRQVLFGKLTTEAIH